MSSCPMLDILMIKLTYFSRNFLAYPLIASALLLNACDIKSTKPVDPPINQAQKIEAEVTKLLAQSHIDPISRFIFSHETDPAYKSANQRLTQEKKQRCDKISKRYQAKAKTKNQLNKLQKGYQFSCPNVVTAFALSIANSKTNKIVDKKEVGNSQQQAKTLQACNQHYEAMDYPNALRYCRQLALHGHAKAQLKLGMIYADGRGINKDYQAAYVWLTLAVQSGIEQAKVLRDSIARLLSKSELVTAHDKAAKISNAY